MVVLFHFLIPSVNLPADKLTESLKEEFKNTEIINIYGQSG